MARINPDLMQVDGGGAEISTKKEMTPEQIDTITRAQVAAGASATDPKNRLLGESASEANARITDAYKEMTAKPILSEEQKAAGAEVKFVRTGAGGVGEYTVIVPIGYDGPPIKVTEWTPGVIPANAKRITGTSLGFNPDDYKTEDQLQAIIAKFNRGETLTADETAFMQKGVPTVAPTPSPTPTGVTPSPTPKLSVTPTPSVGGTPTSTPSVSGMPTPTPSSGGANLVTGTTTTAPLLTTISPTVAATTVAPALTYKASDGTVFTDQSAYVAYQKILTDKAAATAALDAENAKNRQSAYDLLYSEFSKYGLGSLVQPLQSLIQSGASPDEFSLKLRESDAYQKRFSANAARISKGLKAISEAEYINLEDQYQNILRNAGLPESYWKQSVDPRTGITTQEGFTNFIANDVSPLELQDRVATAQQRLIYANPEVSIALKTFYPDITNGDLLAYALDPTKGLDQIKRRITAAEIGSSAVQMGLATNVTDAEYLARYGVTKEQAQQGYRTAAEILPTASKLGDIYATQGMGPYTQQTAEQEIFNVPGAAEAAAKRRKLAGLEQASFSGQAGTSQGALARERAGNF